LNIFNDLKKQWGFSFKKVEKDNYNLHTY